MAERKRVTKPPPLPVKARGTRPPPPPPPRVPKPAFGGANLRTHRRFDVAIAADVRVGDEIYAARTRDISEGGVGLEVTVEIEHGAGVWLSLFFIEDEIEAEGGEPLTVRGNVMWRSVLEPGKLWASGIKFSDMEPDERKELVDFLSGLG